MDNQGHFNSLVALILEDGPARNLHAVIITPDDEEMFPEHVAGRKAYLALPSNGRAFWRNHAVALDGLTKACAA